jgi:DNA-binding MarR family transcriptional regulator
MPRPRQHFISTKRALNEELAPDDPEALKGCNRQLATCDGLIQMNAGQKSKPHRRPEATYDLNNQIGFRLRLALQKHTDIFFKNMDSGLTQPQFATLAPLHTVGACSQNHLGRSVGLDTSSIVGVIRRLKARKLISIAKDKEDRRRVIIDLTPGGRSVIAEAVEMGQRANDLTLAPLSAIQRKQLIQLLALLVPSEQQDESE